MVGKAGTRHPTIQAVALLLPAAARHCHAWQWLVVTSSAQQKKQQNHQQLTNGSTILKTFMFPDNLDLFNLPSVSFGSILANILFVFSNQSHFQETK
jgi:hypothetical protein